MSSQIFIGPVIHCNSQGELILHENTQINVKNGKIEKVIVNPDPNSINRENVKYLKKGQFLVPGFIDAHVHAVQVPNIGLGYDKSLLDWLDAYTFPLEKQYADTKFARRVFNAVVKRTLKLGTTTACYYASLHGPASLILAEEVVTHGQRALVGKVNMNSCPDTDYCETGDNSLRDTEKFIEEVQNIGSPLVTPIITPRFALSCDMNLMKKLGDLAKRKNVAIQTHISETIDEVEAVRNNFSEYPSYAAVYDAANLLTNKTVLAHGVHLSDSELDIIRERKSAIAHCPSSNTCLKSGLCNVRKLQEANIKVGLGTDVGGGNCLSIIDVMRRALDVSVHLSFSKSDYRPLNYKEVFYLATLGGAEALAMEDQIGNFEPGKEFDALVIDLASTNSPIDNFREYSLDEQLQRLIYSGDDRNIVEVYVSGKHVV